MWLSTPWPYGPLYQTIKRIDTSSSPDFVEIYRNFGPQNNEFLNVCSFAVVYLRNSSVWVQIILQDYRMKQSCHWSMVGGLMMTSLGTFAETQGCFFSSGLWNIQHWSSGSMIQKCTQKAKFFLASPQAAHSTVPNEHTHNHGSLPGCYRQRLPPLWRYVNGQNQVL